MLKVLIVDDSAVARELLEQILSSDPDIQVVAVAKNGQEAVEFAKKYCPDIITMDIHMPVMNGFEATKEIMIECPTPIVIVSASSAVNDVEWAMQSLHVGALTLQLKPSGPDSPSFDRDARELIESVKTMAEVRVMRHRRHADDVRQILGPATPHSMRLRVQAVAIAASTGGPPALHQVLSGLPADFPVPVLLVQHIADGFAEGFASWLNLSVPPAVKIAEDREVLQRGTVYVAPQAKHLGVSSTGRVVLSATPPVDGFRPSATHLFESCSRAFGSKVVGIVLTGMGRDGADGLRALREQGGHTIAQDEATSVVYGMPGVVVAEGLADTVLPIDQIAAHLVKLVTRRE
ncbi:MAG: chemotaxis-specific protein-glutamate methyltransferase CheB [Planctomycetaceae bacterium]|nr:chemotaxis-specific protein-glutamate methyltransferase CheB [Planctomycetales bacterium]MCA9170952.1 chemotaxis-specific protein-glutamate methyltransferase CheB [Planctomycetales bacterium]MCB9873457.1 chemotaxis-specific protein-glutamate methyltransferase CheB [Planctomycetaceae bacterium]MCB9940367.1 chemotaxis-specific protein-glutamate methyltransferase CheB [Planctomycetaceae bacterium]